MRAIIVVMLASDDGDATAVDSREVLSRFVPISETQFKSQFRLFSKEKKFRDLPR
jgi:hypothetical protein